MTATRVWVGTVAPEWTVRTAGASDREVSRAPDWEAADDRALVEACLAGDRDAFEPIVRRHQRQIYQVCFRFTGNHEDASDLAQDVFVRAYRGLRGFKGQAALGTWLYRIAVNACLNRAAIKAPRPGPLDGADLPDVHTEHPDSRLMLTERAREVRAAISRLPKKQRATLILRVYHDLPHDQIAAILGSSVGAVKANFFHALANLKKLLK
jgi:RNA polymerase sigma-70 factor (ECF subfamily)